MSGLMQAVRLPGKEKAVVEMLPIPVPGEGQALLRVAVSALCGSERADYREGTPGVAGHEFAGTVEEIGAGTRTSLRVGQRVAVRVVSGCGACHACHAGTPQLCREFSVCNGGHAQYAVVPVSGCLPLPADMDWEMGVLLGGDTLGVAFRALRKLRPSMGNMALVSGAGPIGLGAAALLRHQGWRLWVTEPDPWRRDFARKVSGVEEVWSPDDADLEDWLLSASGGTGPDAVLECSGNAAAQLKAMEWVRPGGTVVLCGENYKALQLIPSHHIIHREVQLTGAFYFTADDFQELCLLWRRGFEPRSAVSHRFPLDQAPLAFQTFFAGKAGKVLLTR